MWASLIKTGVRAAAAYAALLGALGCLAWMTLLWERDRTESGLRWAGHYSEPREEDLTEEEPPLAGKTSQDETGKGADLTAPKPPAAPTLPAPLPPPPRTRPLVVVDAGHGGGDGGAVANALIEKNLTLALALRVRRELERLEIDVRMTRSKDEYLSLEARAALANRLRADAFVSLHMNSAGPAKDVHGIETYFCTAKSLSAARAIQAAFKLHTLVGMQDRRGEKLAAVVQRHTAKVSGGADRGIKERGYTVVQSTACPAVLIECGFITNAAEAARLKTEAYQNKLAAGIAQGVAAFLQSQALDPKRGIEVPPPLHGPPFPADLISQRE